MGKNAYEIRLDTLNLARDILSENYRNQLDMWRETRNDASVAEVAAAVVVGVTGNIKAVSLDCILTRDPG